MPKESWNFDEICSTIREFYFSSFNIIIDLFLFILPEFYTLYTRSTHDCIGSSVSTTIYTFTTAFKVVRVKCESLSTKTQTISEHSGRILNPNRPTQFLKKRNSNSWNSLSQTVKLAPTNTQKIEFFTNIQKIEFLLTFRKSSFH